MAATDSLTAAAFSAADLPTSSAAWDAAAAAAAAIAYAPTLPMSEPDTLIDFSLYDSPISTALSPSPHSSPRPALLPPTAASSGMCTNVLKRPASPNHSVDQPDFDDDGTTDTASSPPPAKKFKPRAPALPLPVAQTAPLFATEPVTPHAPALPFAAAAAAAAASSVVATPQLPDTTSPVNTPPLPMSPLASACTDDADDSPRCASSAAALPSRSPPPSHHQQLSQPDCAARRRALRRVALNRSRARATAAAFCAGGAVATAAAVAMALEDDKSCVRTHAPQQLSGCGDACSTAAAVAMAPTADVASPPDQQQMSCVGTVKAESVPVGELDAGASIAASGSLVDKKAARAIRNREAAMKSRIEAKQKMRKLQDENNCLAVKVRSLSKENEALTSQLRNLLQHTLGVSIGESQDVRQVFDLFARINATTAS